MPLTSSTLASLPVLDSMASTFGNPLVDSFSFSLITALVPVTLPDIWACSSSVRTIALPIILSFVVVLAVISLTTTDQPITNQHRSTVTDTELLQIRYCLHVQRLLHRLPPRCVSNWSIL